MINFRPGKKSLRLQYQSSTKLFDELYFNNKAINIVAISENNISLKKSEIQVENNQDRYEKELLLSEIVEWQKNNDQSTHKKSDKKIEDLVANHTEDELLIKLLKIQSDAQTYIQEQGANLLFVAMGFLHWYESDSSEKERIAPLLMIPVTIKRSGSRDTFKIKYTGEDVVKNLSLVAKLKSEFNIQIPEPEIDSFENENGCFTLDEFYKAVSEKISRLNRWKVDVDEVHLGFFSFGKFLMFKDLLPETWPEGVLPSRHSVLNALLGDGFRDGESKFHERDYLDSLVAPGDVSFVKDADSSQTLAILDVRSGLNLVIQGPPGTGKSQTITNIIADCIGQDKKVLFVAEKMAALEVVKRRLDESNLGDAVLELHSHKSTRIAVIGELAKTLGQGMPRPSDSATDLNELKDLQEQLTKYCDLVNCCIGNSSLPFIQVLGSYLKLKRENQVLPNFALGSVSDWKITDYKHKRRLVTDVTLLIKKMGCPPSQNLFWGSSRTEFNPFEQSKLLESISLIKCDAKRLLLLGASVSSQLGIKEPNTLFDVINSVRIANQLVTISNSSGISLMSFDWKKHQNDVEKLVTSGKIVSTIYDSRKATLRQSAWGQDVSLDRENFRNYGNKWWRFFSKKYRSSRKSLNALCLKKAPTKYKECLAVFDDIIEYNQQLEQWKLLSDLGGNCFSGLWNGLDSDWKKLESLSSNIFSIQRDVEIGLLPKNIIINFLESHSDKTELTNCIYEIESTYQSLVDKIQEIVQNLEIESNISSPLLEGMNFTDLNVRLDRWIDNIEKLSDWVNFNRLADNMDKNGLGSIVDCAKHWYGNDFELENAFDLAWYSSLLEHAYSTHPELSNFSSILHEDAIRRFRELDKRFLTSTQIDLACKVWQKMPNINQPGEIDVLRTEINKRRRHISIRQLISKAGRAIQDIKPIFMMSPMSIANFLAPGSIRFDVVIFDEASQVKSVDAFGAILRGQQVIVVGDTRQMPPTDFFSQGIENEDENSVTADIESILSLFKAKGAQERDLSWHYRSRHESLIAVSNIEFYDQRLIVFPASGMNPLATGLQFHHIPDAVYDRGRTRTNRKEAIAVAKAVFAHAAKHPNLSLGVVAFSMAQRDLIEIEIELARRDNPELEHFFGGDKPEPFFIKNLENVQGDERDVIFISIGYGRNETGRIDKSFGPLNRQGGERRLNVLISRAKSAMHVFSNFRGQELDLDTNASHGVRALKHFLTYAETGELNIPIETGKSTESPFEDEVIFALKERGYEIEPQVGTAGYFIDIGVKDPDLPGRYILAIECDGASYHSARSARDRDRLRQEVLQGLGWRFHRIWSTDWFRNPAKEVEKAIKAIEDARKSIKEPTVSTSNLISQAPVLVRQERQSDEPQYQPEFYRKAVLDNPVLIKQGFYDLAPEQMVGLINELVEIEAPVHESDVISRIVEFFGIKRAGRIVSEKIQSGITAGSRSQRFVYDNGFLYRDAARQTTIRSRAEFSPGEKKIERVAPEEIDAALIKIISLGFSMTKENAIIACGDLLGFGRVTTNIATAIAIRIDALLENSKLACENDLLKVMQ